MAILEANARNAAANAVVDLIDGVAAGTLVCETSADAAVATLTFSNPAFGNATGGVATATGGITSDTNATGGTIAQVSFYGATGGGTKVLEATAATSGAEFTFSSLVVSNGDTVSVSSVTVTQPAS